MLEDQAAAGVPISAIRRSTKLLVSVQNAAEAELAHECGVDWIDLKNPSAGSLGAPDRDTIQSVSKMTAESMTNASTAESISLSNHSTSTSSNPASVVKERCIVKSVALGEINDVDFRIARESVAPFAVAKVGTSGIGQLRDAEAWSKLYDLYEKLGRGKLIAAAYADYERANAPSPEKILTWSATISAPYLLIDTFVKDGLGLPHWLEPQRLQKLIAAADRAGMGVALAGSLKLSDAQWIASLSPDYIAVRGAVCSGERNGPLCSAKIHAWLTELTSWNANSDSRSTTH
ncbi:MAG: (5-formylfuran-3-yl)methyl phosphate synthase [Pirellulales bacterium]